MQDGELLFYKLIDIHKERDAMKRIRYMLTKICEVLDQYDIDAIYIEKAFGGGNVDTTIKLANLSGGIMLYCIQKEIEFNNPLPSQWRKLVGIAQGKGVKREVQKAEAVKAVKDAYGITAGDDVCEAICIARSAFNLPKFNITEDDLWS